MAYEIAVADQGGADAVELAAHSRVFGATFRATTYCPPDGVRSTVARVPPAKSMLQTPSVRIGSGVSAALALMVAVVAATRATTAASNGRAGRLKGASPSAGRRLTFVTARR